MFPLRDDNPQFLTPYVTYALIALNILAWLLLQGMGSEPALSSSLCVFGLTPGELLNTVTAGSETQIGAQTWCVLSDSRSSYTLLTSMFMHGGWMHLIGNMWFLWVFGNNVEDSMGHMRFAVFYITCGVAAAAGQIISNPDSTIPMVGASGAIGGVMGAYIVLYPRVRVHMLIFLGIFITTFAVPAIFMLGYWFLLQVIGGFSSVGASGGGTAFWAHIGGFAAGAVLINVFKVPALVDRHPYHGWKPQQSPTQNWRRIR